ncbi:hypothetical protein Efla_007748 [Eimeria flavescens]
MSAGLQRFLNDESFFPAEHSRAGLMDSVPQGLLLAEARFSKLTTFPFEAKHTALPDEHRRPASDGHLLSQRLASLGRRQSCRNGNHLIALFAALTSVAVIFFCILTCRAVFSSAAGSRTVGRRLSEGGDSSGPEVSTGVCPDKEEVPGRSEAREPHPASSQLSSTSASENVEHQAAEDFEDAGTSPGQDASEVHGENGQPSARTGGGEKRRADALPSEPISKKRALKPSGDDGGDSGRSSLELLAAEALLSLHQTHGLAAEQAGSAVSQPAAHSAHFMTALPGMTLIPGSGGMDLRVQTHLVSPSLVGFLPIPEQQQPSSSLGGTPPPAAGALSGEGISRTGPMSQSPDMPQNEDEGFLTATLSAGEAAAYQETTDEGEPSTSLTVHGSRGGLTMGFHAFQLLPHDGQPGASSAVHPPVVASAYAQHPFFRLPLVNVPQQARPRVNTKLEPYGTLTSRQLHPLLHIARELLVKPALEKQDLIRLSAVVHELISYGYHYEVDSAAHKRATRACQVLGRRFLLLDAVLSGLQVLGDQPRGEWWETFAAAVSHDADEVRPEEPVRSPVINFNRRLMRKLVQALRVLKTGARLSAQETVTLKQMLLCSPLSPKAFLKSPWDLWRQDDRDFNGSGGLQKHVSKPPQVKRSRTSMTWSRASGEAALTQQDRVF